MAKLNCICGNQLSNVASPNEIEGILLTDMDIDDLPAVAPHGSFPDGTIWEWIMNTGREVWECWNCGRIAFNHPGRGDNTVKWYRPENGEPGHLMRHEPR